MPFHDDIDGIDARIDARVRDPFVSGYVVSVQPRFVYIRVAGSSRNVKAYYSEAAPPGVGEKAMAVLNERENRYVLFTAYAGVGSGTGVGKRAPEDFALSPPNNVAAVAMVAAILVQWDDPIAQSLAFEVQTNSSASDVGAATHIVTRSSILIATATTLYARVRSVTSKFQYSSWSAWVNATPVALTTDYASLTDVDMTGIADGDVPIWDAATSTWLPGAGGGAFVGDATDVPYTPTTSGNWSIVPANVGEGLDNLAADVAVLSGGGSRPETDITRWTLFR